MHLPLSRPALTRRALIRAASLTAASATLATLAACSSANTEDDTMPTGSPSPDGGTLLVFFSRAGENYWNGGRRVLDTGNTDRLARSIRDRADVDTFRIEAAEAYPEAYDPTVSRNSDEQERDARPAIAGALPDLSGYGTVLLGSPIWNVRPPMIMSTFLESVDLTGVRVLPFVTYAVSGAGDTAGVYRPLTRSASSVSAPFAVRGEDVDGAASEVDRWLQRHRLVG
jgi:flavodoxin